MNNNFSYTGVVTLIHKIGDRVVSKVYHNEGTQNLFEAYARAISGQDISNFIPKYIRIFNSQTISSGEAQGVDTVYGMEVTKNPIPITVVFKDGKDVESTKAEYKGPYARVSGILTKSMITDSMQSGDAVLTLHSSKILDESTRLATLSIKDFFTDVNSMSSGAHYVILWDLYVENDIKSSQPTNGGTN